MRITTSEPCARGPFFSSPKVARIPILTACRASIYPILGSAHPVTPDPSTGTATRLFHPRLDDWDEHFQWEGFELIGLTDVGRATIAALDLNHPRRVRIREVEKLLGLFSPGEPRSRPCP